MKLFEELVKRCMVFINGEEVEVPAFFNGDEYNSDYLQYRINGKGVNVYKSDCENVDADEKGIFKVRAEFWREDNNMQPQFENIEINFVK